MKRGKEVIVVLALLVVVVSALHIAVAQPNGAAVSDTNTERSLANATAGTDEAYAGNISELSITGTSTTQSWQGYYGNVSGGIALSDASGNALYNWSLADPEGEVYASTNQTITWANIQCFNFTALGNYSEESGNGGTVNMYGTNLTQLEARYGIASDDLDGVNETFTLSGAGTHDAFFTGSQSFSEGECQSTRLNDATGQGVSNNFEEALLYEPSTTSVVFVAILEAGAVSGFNNGDNDFEMIVLENGHGADVTATTYYFFVEIE